jgi:deoxyribose-phosphate aldolase
LKTADQAGLDEKDNVKVVTGFIQEAIDEHFKLIMIRPDMVSLPVRFLMQVQTSNRDCYRFSRRNSTVADKLFEAKRQFRMERTIWMFVIRGV